MHTTNPPRAVREVFDRLNAVPLESGADQLLAVMRAQDRIENHWPDVLPAPIPEPASAATDEARRLLDELLNDPALGVADRLAIAGARAELLAAGEARA